MRTTPISNVNAVLRGTKLAILIGLLLIVFFPMASKNSQAAEKKGQAISLEQLRDMRKEAAHRKRRIIFNNDGNEPVYYCEKATAKNLLDRRTTPLADSQVDTIFYCTWSSGFSIFTHNTAVGQIFTTTENPKHTGSPVAGFSKNVTADFIRQGTDPLKIMVAWCKSHNKEIFWSFRMNDTHDSGNTWYAPCLFPQLKKDHPEWLVSTREKHSKRGGWSAVDYGRPEIRDLAFRFTKEVCENYDIDGVELDYFRHLISFKANAQGHDCGPEEREQMTSLIRRIRQMTEQVGQKRGRPILLSVRIPDSVDYCEASGFDITQWLREGLIDTMAVSGYFRLNDWKTSVELGHRYGVPVYPCLSETRLRDLEAKRVRGSLPSYRARAETVLASGADGVYMFNFFNPRSPLWHEVGSLETLQDKTKIYTTGARGVNTANSWLQNGLRFLQRQVVSPERPLALVPGKAAVVELPVGQVPPSKTKVQLRLRMKGLASVEHLAVKLNGEALATGKKSGNWLQFAVEPSLVKQGNNRFEIVLAPVASSTTKVEDLLLQVK